MLPDTPQYRVWVGGVGQRLVGGGGLVEEMKEKNGGGGPHTSVFRCLSHLKIGTHIFVNALF